MSVYLSCRNRDYLHLYGDSMNSRLNRPQNSTFGVLIASTILLNPLSMSYAQTTVESYAPITPWAEEKASNTLKQRAQPTQKMDIRKESFNQDEASRIETFYATRIVDELEQYGYDLFENRTNTTAPLPTGGVQRDSVIIGVGDTLEIILRGQINERQDYTISPQGLLILDQFPPISVIGLTLKQLQERLALEADSLVNTDIYVTLKTIRQVSITIAGNVETPGRQILTPTHTIMDALQSAGGVNKSGTLRNIKLIRDGKTRIIDLYGLLQNGTSRADVPLRDGDKIIVPSIGATLAIAGDVKNPAIFEIPKGHKYALATLFGLSGGLISPSEYRFIKLGVNQHGQEITEEINSLSKKQFGDGSILVVSRRIQTRKGAVEIEGNATTQGIHDIRQSKTLSELLPDRASFENDVYPLIGLIERWNEKTLAPEYIPFSPLQIVNKQADEYLSQNDKIHIFSRHDMETITAPSDGSHVHEAQPHTKIPAPKIPDRDIPELIQTILKEHAIYVRGAVRKKGLYPAYKDTTLQDIISVAGGYTLEADQTTIEVTENIDGHTHRQTINLQSNNSANDVNLKPGDTIRVASKTKALAEKTVHIYGEITSTGKYDLMPGDTLLSLIERSGGITEHAYPEGTIFSRKSERKREENRFKAEAKDLQLKLASMLETKEKPDQEQVRSIETLIRDLESARAVGRITVEADPETLITQPELNILLEAGDKIYIPKRPMTVRVAGEVLSPSALQFRSEKSPSEYINQAGGFTYHADKSRAFAILPDGSAQPLRVNYWNHQASFLPPGSTIIVPRDPKPFDIVESAKDISQIVANLAVTAVLADEIGDDD